MPKYSNGKIYKIIDESNGDIYIGSTLQELKTRFRTHGMFKLYNKNKSNCKINLIERYPCKYRSDLERREQYWIDNSKCINKNNAVKYEKTWGDKRFDNNLLMIDPDLFRGSPIHTL
jgi:predicted GIY-YIG superfamily endonuclease